MGILILATVAVAGRFVLHWRREAIGGFGLGRLNRPAILWTAGGQIAVWLLGQVLLWGGAGAIWVGANFPNTARSVTTLACARGRFFNLTFALPNGETNSIRTPPN